MSHADLSLPDPGTIIMFSTAWCGYCRRLKTYLEVEQIRYREVNIEETPDAVAFVEKINGGQRTVPTILFPDGSAATNPTLAEVQRRLGL